MIKDEAPPRPSRRWAILGAGSMLGALTAAAAAPPPIPSPMARTAGKSVNWSRTHLHQEVRFKSPPAPIYQALLNSQQFAAFSGMAATIEPTAGGAFTLFGGQVVGRNVELVPNKRIVQAWRVIRDWPEGVYSLVRMELAQIGPGTLLALDHTGFQEGDFDHLNAGWAPHYWDPLHKLFG